MMMTLAFTVARKEIRDHLRDRRSLLSAAMLSLMGPVVVAIVSMSERAGPRSDDVAFGMLSIFALVSSFVGAIDIAMDATAGERERRSLLPLLLNPIPVSHVVVGKWIAVTCFACAALGLNAFGLVTVLAWTSPVLLAERLVPITLWIALGLVPLACLGAATSLLVAATCRTTKEAHSALRFVTFVPMLIGLFLVFFPRASVDAWFVPIVGQQALIGLEPHNVSVARVVVLAFVTLASVVPVLRGATSVMRQYATRSA
jgi:sodium transport system permease protein